MNKTQNSKLTRYAQELRNSMTKEERHLWYDFLKSLPYNVNRQKVIGNYIVDFYIPCYKIVIELDGSQHYENDAKMSDEKRDKYLNGLGMSVLRYSNLDVKNNFSGVCDDILNHIATSSVD